MELGIDEMLAPAKGEAARGLRSAKSKMIEVSLPAGDPRLPVPELPVRLSDIKTAASALRTGKQAAAKAHLVKFDQLPFIERNAAGEPVRGPIKNTYLVGKSVLPGLGQEGELMAAFGAAIEL